MFKKFLKEVLQKNELSDDVPELLNHTMEKIFHSENDRKNAAEIISILTSEGRKELRIPSELMHYLGSNPRGNCLVINVYKFRGESRCRSGSDKDFESVQKLWKDLGYKVFAYQNKSKRADGYNDLSRKDVNKLVEEFAQMESHKEVDSSVVIIMTHGTEDPSNPKAVNLMGSDKLKINTELLLDYFSLSRCPHLANKPKFFFFQACRGSLENKAWPEMDCDIPYETDEVISGQQGEARGGEKDEIQTFNNLLDSGNQLIVFPSAPGFKSIRDPADGSWFIQAMYTIFSQNAHNTDALTMLDMVNNYVKEHFVITQEGEVVVSQVLCIEKRGFDRYVFFDPTPLR